MTSRRSLFEVLAVLSAGATLLAGCADSPPPQAAAPAGGTEVPAAGQAPAQAAPAAPAQAAPAAPAQAAPASTPQAAPPPGTTSPAAGPAPAKSAAPKAMPPKIPNSKRVADKSSQGCCGQGTC